MFSHFGMSISSNARTFAMQSLAFSVVWNGLSLYMYSTSPFDTENRSVKTDHCRSRCCPRTKLFRRQTLLSRKCKIQVRSFIRIYAHLTKHSYQRQYMHSLQTGEYERSQRTLRGKTWYRPPFRMFTSRRSVAPKVRKPCSVALKSRNLH